MQIPRLVVSSATNSFHSQPNASIAFDSLHDDAEPCSPNSINQQVLSSTMKRGKNSHNKTRLFDNSGDEYSLVNCSIESARSNASKISQASAYLTAIYNDVRQ